MDLDGEVRNMCITNGHMAPVQVRPQLVDERLYHGLIALSSTFLKYFWLNLN